MDKWADAETARLIYLLTEHRVDVPKSLLRYLPFWRDWLPELKHGLSAAARAAGASTEHMMQLYAQGAASGKGSRAEALHLLGEMVDDEVSATNGHRLSLDEKLNLYQELAGLLSSGEMLQNTEVELANAPKVSQIPKWDSGFTPLDVLTGGLYQGVMILVGMPGLGKTSLMLAIQERIAALGSAGGTLFFQNEIPMQLMLGRLNQGPLRRTAYRATDRLICGSFGTEKVLSVLERMPQEQQRETVVFFDSPDVVVGSDPETRRFVLEHAFQVLVQAKQLCKLVIVSSQPNRRTAEAPRLSGLAEAWSKAWYADIVIALSRGRRIGGLPQLKLTLLKNRFGPPEGSVLFHFNLADLSWDPGSLAAEEDDDVWR